MVKIPNNVERSAPPAFLEERTQFLHDYGAFLFHYSEFELAIEIKIAKLTGLAGLDASIVLGSLNAKAKQHIISSLLRERGLDDVASKINKVITHAKRNALVHGQIATDPDDPRFVFFKREVGDTYVVKSALKFTATTFNDFFERLRVLVFEAVSAMGVTPHDIEEYGREARLVE